MTSPLADKWVRCLAPNIPEHLCESLKTIAAACPNVEICGLIYDDLKFCPIANDAEDPASSFHMSAASIRMAIGLYGEEGITGIYHSHTSGQPYMSVPDAENAAALYEAGCTWRYLIVTADQVTEYRYLG